jgi:chemotaxis protein MotB
MAIPEEPSPGIPEWIVTYGDMMSLLLTFFIMLVSMSELKQNDKFQGIADSLQQHFGYDTSMQSVVPGELRPRNASFAALALAGRSKRIGAMEGTAKERSTTGTQPRVRIIRPGNRTTIGTVIYFSEPDTQLDSRAQADLREVASVLGGKPQKIEVRGHTSQRPLTPGERAADHWELAYRRSHAAMEFLVQELKIDPQRIRISVAGPYEPAHISADPQRMRENPRVEVFMLEEVASDLAGTPEEQLQRYNDASP